MDNQEKIIYLKDYEPPQFFIDEVFLDVTLPEIKQENVKVGSVLHFKKNPDIKNTKKTSEKDLFLNGVDLKLHHIAINGKKLNDDHYEITAEGLMIKNLPDLFTNLFPDSSPSSFPDSFQLETLVSIDIYNNKSLEGMYFSGKTICTQNEAEGFRKITYFLDRSDVMSRFTTKITAPKEIYPTLLAGGNCIKTSEDPSKKTHSKTFYDPSLKPCYLFALVAGKLSELQENFTTKNGRKVKLSIFSEQPSEELGEKSSEELGEKSSKQENLKKLDFAMQSLKRAMRFDEKVFSLEYDLDEYKIVAVDSFNFGAMENKGLNIFNSSLIISDDKTTTDNEQIEIEAVIAHEYFHNWSGNRVTLRDWFQLTLKEGLTVFRDQEFTASHHSPLVKRIKDVTALRERQFNEDSGPLSHPIQPASYKQINNFYTATIYEKGAEVVRMYKTLLGDQAFFKALSIYFSRYDGKAITVNEFFEVMQECHNDDLAQFKKWYSTHGTPHVKVEEEWEKESKDYTVTLSQHITNNKKAEPLLIPLRYSLFSKQGEEIKNDIFLLEKSKQSFKLKIENQTEKPLLSINRGFSAPIELQQNLKEDDLFNLLKIENDGFNRWDFLQQLFFSSFHSYQKQKDSFQINTSFLETLRNLLTKEKDYYYVSQCFSLPSYNGFVAHEEKLDFEEIHAFRKTFIHQLGSYLKEDLLNGYEKLSVKDHMAERSLKNILLSLLCDYDSNYRELAYNQFSNAKNMTDVYYALSLLCKNLDELSKKALSSFYDKWKNDNLVMNKWFAAQARSQSENVFKTINDLSKHPSFNIEEPNKVYALLAVFAFHNHLRFHDTTGKGYQLVSEKVLILDSINPTVAARLLTSFGYYKKLQPKLKEKAIETLKTLKQKINSKGSKEILENLLTKE